MPSEVTQLLQRAAAGDSSAREPLYRALYPMLMRLAQGHLARAGTVSLDASALLHEAYLRLNGQGNLPDTNRRVFFAYASRVMRSVIVDYVRERGAQKRGSNVPALTLSNNLAESIFSENSLSDIERALRALEAGGRARFPRCRDALFRGTARRGHRGHPRSLPADRQARLAQGAGVPLRAAALRVSPGRVIRSAAT